MDRIPLTTPDGEPAGWFDYDRIAGRWDDRDPVTGHGSHGNGRGEAVILTASGRWVLQHWTHWQGETPRHQQMAPIDVRQWLMDHDHDDAVLVHFDAVPETDQGGRPVSVGGQRRPVQMPDELWDWVDTQARAVGISAGEFLRRLTAVAKLAETTHSGDRGPLLVGGDEHADAG